MINVEVTGPDERGVAALSVTGEMDISSAADFEREIRRIEEAAPRVLVMDLRNLTFIDSTGLRLVLGADARAQEEGRRLVVTRGPDSVDRVFRIALLDRRLEFVDGLDDVHVAEEEFATEA